MGQKCHASGRIRRQGGSKKNTLSPNMVDSSPDSDESDSVPLNAKGHPTTAGKLFFNRCINTHLGMVFQPTRLTDTLKLSWFEHHQRITRMNITQMKQNGTQKKIVQNGNQGQSNPKMCCQFRVGLSVMKLAEG